MKTLIIHGSEIKIRPFIESDIDTFFSSLKKSNVSSYFFPTYFLSSYKFKKKFLETGLLEDNGGYVLVVDKDNENILGYIWFAKSTCFEGLLINYHQFSSKKEYMIEAVNKFCLYLFASKRINRLQIFIPNYDRNAITIARESSFKFEGIIRQAMFDNGKYTDLCIYSKLREDNDKSLGNEDEKASANAENICL